jgi:pimeloyl-ACP methyl ester carboxylesterase
MKLKVHEWGSPAAEKTALLIHGVMSSAGTWVRVAPLLVERGYRVIAPDLRGHGESSYADSYTSDDFAADLVQSLPAGADVAIGHSLGGRSLLLAVDELAPGKAVYCDPAWKLSGAASAAGADATVMAQYATMTKTMTAEQIQQMNPRWAPEDVAAEQAGFAAWDVKVMDAVAAFSDLDVPAPKIPSLVQAADPSLLISPKYAEQLRALGYKVRVVPNTGHCIYRDDLAGFMASLVRGEPSPRTPAADGWI